MAMVCLCRLSRLIWTIFILGAMCFEAQEMVTLSSTLNADHIAVSQQQVIFTCITRGSPILEWFSEEYIGTGGDRLQFPSINCIGVNMTGRIDPNTVATCLSVSQTGETVIQSQLVIIASVDHPQATVTCSNNGHGTTKNITFMTIAQEMVTLSSTLNADRVAVSQQQVIFTCITRGSRILEWFSEEYIGTGGDRLQFPSINCIGVNMTGRIDPNTVATCLSVSQMGETVIQSQLVIIASVDHPQATVTCSNNGHGTTKNITFMTIDMIDLENISEPRTTVTVTSETGYGPTQITVMDITNKQPQGLVIVIAVALLLVIVAFAYGLINILICVYILYTKRHKKHSRPRGPETESENQKNGTENVLELAPSMTSGYGTEQEPAPSTISYGTDGECAPSIISGLTCGTEQEQGDLVYCNSCHDGTLV